ncbi:dihydrofolate reductase family protein [Piscinibacter gummiphilus]|uniref:Dihydrofolate reductase family protein n=1 Tax=Piscinibacter gummiphilus TaxID=946333 RepID=A0ABZ0CRZ4_9BURK|nr:dihydrofolate reductase family protein [Piscinibacter gummiphilus]WOB07758.1 dihydrofolate reductase family protein [Piscinibacter gummiphilus]
MAQLIVSQLISLDGHLAGPGGDLSRLPMGGSAFDRHNVELLRRAGTLLFGRTTFGMFQGYWPQVERDTNAAPVQREIASLTRSVRRLVVSDTLKLDGDDPWHDAEVVRRADSRARIAQLKASETRDLLMYGGTQVWQDLYAAGLVDELHLLIGNVVLGAGVPAFASGVSRPMTLLGQRRLPESEIVALHYRVS